ncbi:class I adenylate-forming enzyme family protein [Kribbia dieselivorans]|uniref:class I adenylate-forming enzyme family protein n=1 Tax=Kribbia dieselivorans TaxID=331526 RepID=UPI00083960F5|nr:AMP-binding protein [Kribbia dieselivorans]
MWRHPEIRTLPDIVDVWADRTPDRVALVAGDAELTWQQLAERVIDLAVTLVNCGEPRQPIAYLGHNTLELWVTWFAANRARRPFVPLNWRLAVPEIAALLRDCAPAVVVTQEDFADALQTAVSQVAQPIDLWPFVSVAAGGSGLDPRLTGVDGTVDLPRPISEDISLIAYTSGTTGQPKGALHRHDGFDLSILSDELEPTIRTGREDVHLMAMPNFHLAGTWVSLPTLYHGGTVAMIPFFEPAAVLEALTRHRPTTLCLVPTAIQWLVDEVRRTGADVSSLRTLIYAGSAITPPTIEGALEALGCELRQFYGTTETYIISILRPDDHDASRLELVASAGAPVPLVHVRIVDPMDHDCPAGEVGEVLVRSPYVMAGYLGQPEASAAAFTDGWYRTGDLGFHSSAGQLTLVDRAKDMVVTAGENVYSVEVERALGSHPDVAMAAVIGVPDERWGEAVTAFVVPAQGRDVDPDALRAHCREHIAGYKVPKSIHIRTSLPLTPSGKVRKVDLRTEAAS